MSESNKGLSATFPKREAPQWLKDLPVVPSRDDFEAAAARLDKLTYGQFYHVAQIGNLAIDAVLADIRDVLLYARHGR